MEGDIEAPVEVVRLGLQSYEPIRAAMRRFTLSRDASTPDQLWLLEHLPVYTLGQAGRLAHLHTPVALPVIHTERGGQITYHGPGQLVVYPLVDLRRRGLRVREFVQLIERAVIDVLATYNLAARVQAGAPGVYVDTAGGTHKIAALGLKIVNGRSFHGLSLNVEMDLTPYASIDACGFPGLRSIDMATLGARPAVSEVGERLQAGLIDALDTASR